MDKTNSEVLFVCHVDSSSFTTFDKLTMHSSSHNNDPVNAASIPGVSENLETLLATVVAPTQPVVHSQTAQSNSSAHGVSIMKPATSTGTKSTMYETTPPLQPGGRGDTADRSKSTPFALSTTQTLPRSIVSITSETTDSAAISTTLETSPTQPNGGKCVPSMQPISQSNSIQHITSKKSGTSAPSSTSTADVPQLASSMQPSGSKSVPSPSAHPTFQSSFTQHVTSKNSGTSASTRTSTADVPQLVSSTTPQPNGNSMTSNSLKSLPCTTHSDNESSAAHLANPTKSGTTSSPIKASTGNTTRPTATAPRNSPMPSELPFLFKRTVILTRKGSGVVPKISSSSDDSLSRLVRNVKKVMLGNTVAESQQNPTNVVSGGPNAPAARHQMPANLTKSLNQPNIALPAKSKDASVVDSESLLRSCDNNAISSLVKPLAVINVGPVGSSVATCVGASKISAVTTNSDIASGANAPEQAATVSGDKFVVKAPNSGLGIPNSSASTPVHPAGAKQNFPASVLKPAASTPKYGDGTNDHAVQGKVPKVPPSPSSPAKRVSILKRNLAGLEQSTVRTGSEAAKAHVDTGLPLSTSDDRSATSSTKQKPPESAEKSASGANIVGKTIVIDAHGTKNIPPSLIGTATPAKSSVTGQGLSVYSDVTSAKSDPARKLACEICGQLFAHRQSLELHMQVVHKALDDKELSIIYDCRHCQKRFANLVVRDDHERVYHCVGTPLYECEKCQEGFRMLEELVAHSCGSGKPSRRLDFLKAHLNKEKSSNDGSDTNSRSPLIHGKAKAPSSRAKKAAPVKCAVCDMQFPGYYQLSEHLLTHMVDNTRDRCDGLPTNTHDIRSSLRLKERYDRRCSKKAAYKCSSCKLQCVDADQLNEHTKVHAADENLHVCEFCTKSFGTRSHVQRHMQTHSGERPFKCLDCNRQFSTKADLDQHFCLRVRNKGTRRASEYRCNRCGKVFPDSDRLTAHAKTHGSDKAFRCYICKRTLANAWTLSHHLAVHRSDVKSFYCSMCDTAYETRIHFMNHCKTKKHRSAVLAAGREQSLEIVSSPGTVSEKVPEVASPSKFAQTDESPSTGVEPSLGNVANSGFQLPNFSGTAENVDELQTITGNPSTVACQLPLTSQSTPVQTPSLGKRCRDDSTDSIATTSQIQMSTSQPDDAAPESKTTCTGRYFPCDLCGLTFRSALKLSEHTNSHTGKKPYLCMECGQAFAQRQFLMHHRKIHDVDSIPLIPADTVVDHGSDSRKNLTPLDRVEKLREYRLDNFLFSAALPLPDIPELPMRTASESVVPGTDSNSDATETSSEMVAFVEPSAVNIEASQPCAIQQELTCIVPEPEKSTDPAVVSKTPLVKTSMPCQRSYVLLEPLTAADLAAAGVTISPANEHSINTSPVDRDIGGSSESTEHGEGRLVEPQRNTCYKCGYVCENGKVLLAHIRAHGDIEKPFKCRICPAQFCSSRSLSYHIARHDTEFHFTCAKCSDSFYTRTALISHLAANQDHVASCPVVLLKNLRCGRCRRRFPNVQEYSEHMDCHLYGCPHCPSKHFRTALELREHVRTHSDIRFKCARCGEAFATHHLLVSHTIKRMCLRNINDVKCIRCGQEFENADDRDVHRRTCAKSQAVFLCDLCPSRFTGHARLLEHMRVHTGERPYMCDDCGRRFSNKNSLNRHLRMRKNAGSHFRPVEYKCRFCGMPFQDSDMHLAHLKSSHASDVAFKCYVCSKQLQNAVTLSQHLRTHNNKRDFVCSVCDKTFPCRADLISHLRRLSHKRRFMQQRQLKNSSPPHDADYSSASRSTAGKHPGGPDDRPNSADDSVETTSFAMDVVRRATAVIRIRNQRRRLLEQLHDVNSTAVQSINVRTSRSGVVEVLDSWNDDN